jgi:hypothetical protein
LNSPTLKDGLAKARNVPITASFKNGCCASICIELNHSYTVGKSAAPVGYMTDPTIFLPSPNCLRHKFGAMMRQLNPVEFEEAAIICRPRQD